MERELRMNIIMYFSNVPISSNSNCFCSVTVLCENAIQKQNDGRKNLYTVMKEKTASP